MSQSTGSIIHSFQIHHIWPHELFDDDDARDALGIIFPESDTSAVQIHREMAGNEIALFVNADQAAAGRILKVLIRVSRFRRLIVALRRATC